MSDKSLNFPAEFCQLIQQSLVDPGDYAAFLAICQLPLRRSIRVNTLKISVADFLNITQQYQWQLTAIPWCKEGFWIELTDDRLPLGSYAEHLSGLFYIQEASSMLPVTALFNHNMQPSQVLDMAAAPGSKTTQIATFLNGKGLIVANEYSASRLKILHANLSRCAVTQAVVTHFDAKVFGAALPEHFDAILLDAPCSGEGVIRKDPKALSNWDLQSTLDIAALQKQLITSAWQALKPGGRLVYSTCTLNQIENQQIINYLTEQFPDSVRIEPLNTLFDGADRVATPEGFLHVFPQRFDSEGFFVASLRKIISIPPAPTPSYKLGKFPFTPLNKKEWQQLVQQATLQGLVLPDTLQGWKRDNEIWLFPVAIAPILHSIRFSRPGIKLAEIFSREIRWQYEAVIALVQPGFAESLELSKHQAADWYRGRDIFPDNLPLAKQVILTYQQQVLGIAKIVGNRIKNSYPREWVRDGLLFDLEVVADR